MHAGTRLAITVIAFAIVGSASAQDPSSGRFGHAQACARENASRLPPDNNCNEAPADEVVISQELEVITTVRTPAVVINDCQVEITLEYFQRGALAHVEGQIENRMCPASTGTFVVSVRTLQADGESVTQEFPETWENVDGQPLTFEAEYAIGDNVDLTRVRTLRARCRCLTPDTPE